MSDTHADKSGILTSELDPAIRPQDDLFRHVNGKWIERTEIPSDKARYGSFYILAEEAEKAVRDIIEEASEAEPGTEEGEPRGRGMGDEHHLLPVEDGDRARPSGGGAELLADRLEKGRDRIGVEIGGGEREDARGESIKLAVAFGIAEALQGMERAAGGGAGQSDDAGDLAETQAPPSGAEGGDDRKPARQRLEEIRSVRALDPALGIGGVQTRHETAPWSNRLRSFRP